MNEDERREFGAYLRRLREERGLSLREVERSADISNSYLYQIERGDRNPPKMEVLQRLASLYGVSLDSILAAAKFINPDDVRRYYDDLDDELDRAFEYVRRDKRFQFGTQMNGTSLTPEAKRFIVEMYQTFADRKLLGEKE